MTVSDETDTFECEGCGCGIQLDGFTSIAPDCPDCGQHDMTPLFRDPAEMN